MVDYLGLAHELKRALATYTESGGTGENVLDQARAVALMLEKYEICTGLFHGFDSTRWVDCTPAERVSLLPAAQEHVLAQKDGKERCLLAVRELSQAFALAVPHEAALRIRDDVAFFQAVRSVLVKRARGGGAYRGRTRPRRSPSSSRGPWRSDGVMDVFAAAGLNKPDISVLSEEFLAEVQNMPQRNLAVDLLQKLLKGELAARRRKNVVQARSFARMLEQTLRRYRNRAIEAAQVLEALIQLARELREGQCPAARSWGFPKTNSPFTTRWRPTTAPSGCLATRPLRDIARELVETVRGNVTIDWTLREDVRAHLRRLVKRILRKHGYPPDKQERATLTVLEQAEALSAGWAE